MMSEYCAGVVPKFNKHYKMPNFSLIRTVYVGWADENPNDFSRSKPPGRAMALLRPLLGGEGAEEDVELGLEAPPLGTTTPGWPSGPSWTSLNPCLDGTRGIEEQDLTISG